ncbi:MFS transporter [Stygiolobus caldivivus]|uniref:MFS transporter n=1 Tax=Stygiolobus caldivivus TaxID=2824673 RepID=A0A8D5ZIL7_9CREN|nr:MFS transporter [Stygiolobus caldivivus]BCU69736.1 MFS transporter [Stygiolobus caldivivus]
MRSSIALGWFATSLQLALRFSWGVVAVAFAYTLHLNSVEIGSVLFLFYLGYVTSSTPWGVFIDRVGPKIALFISSLSSSLLIPFIPTVRDVSTLYLLYLAEGVLTAGIYPSSVKIISSLEKGLTRDLALLDSAAPTVMLALSLLSPLILTYWRQFFLLLSSSFLVSSLLTLSLKVRVGPSKRSVRVVVDKKVWTVALIRLGEQWGLWGTSSWLFPFLVLYDGVGRSVSEILFVLYAAGQATSIALIRVLKGDDVKLVELSLIAFIASLLVVSLTRDPYLLVPFSFTLGVSSFLCRPPTDSLVVRVVGSGSAGTSMGLANAVSQVGSMVAPLVVGLVLHLGSDVVAIDSLALGPILSLTLVEAVKHNV